MSYFKSNNEERFDISEKILNLSDKLSEEIVLDLIEEELDEQTNLFRNGRINYVSLFKEKYTNIDPEDPDYDRQYVHQALDKVTTLVKTKIHERYKLTFGEDLDFSDPDEYLDNMEAIYEFFFIRHIKNIIDYLNLELRRTKSQLIERYSKLIQDETHKSDVFFGIKSKKFKNIEDVIVFHFIGEMIDDILNSNNSAYVLFERIVSTDPYEETNYKISEMLINYGNQLMFDNDTECYTQYISVLEEPNIKNEVRNAVLMEYLKNVNKEDVEEQ